VELLLLRWLQLQCLVLEYHLKELQQSKETQEIWSKVLTSNIQKSKPGSFQMTFKATFKEKARQVGLLQREGLKSCRKSRARWAKEESLYLFRKLKLKVKNIMLLYSTILGFLLSTIRKLRLSLCLQMQWSPHQLWGASMEVWSNSPPKLVLEDKTIKVKITRCTLKWLSNPCFIKLHQCLKFKFSSRSSHSFSNSRTI